MIPICSQGCERTKGSMSPHVLKWILPLSWKTFIAVKNPAYSQHSTTRGCMKMMMFLCSLCSQIEWGSNGLSLTCLPFSSASSFDWTQARPWFLCCFFSHLPLGLCVLNKLSLAVCQFNGFFCWLVFNTLSLKTVSSISPLRSGVWREIEVQSKLRIRGKWK